MSNGISWFALIRSGGCQILVFVQRLAATFLPSYKADGHNFTASQDFTP
jgi:hypothetical protein